jgi:hypothetical protein
MDIICIVISIRDGEDFTLVPLIILHTFSIHFGRIRNAYKMLVRRPQGQNHMEHYACME